MTQVCREARRVAQLHGKLNCLTLNPAPDSQVWERFWHQLYLYSLHLHLISPLNELRRVRDGETTFTRAMTGAWNMATPLSFSEQLFRLYRQPQYRPHRPQAKEHYAIAAQTGETFRVVFMIITIHLTPAQVASSGLFYHLDDEIVKLVDFDDVLRISGGSRRMSTSNLIGCYHHLSGERRSKNGQKAHRLCYSQRRRSIWTHRVQTAIWTLFGTICAMILSPPTIFTQKT